MQLPTWWSRDHAKTPITHVYRAMRIDSRDLMPVPANRPTANKKTIDEFRKDVMEALVEGSIENSLLLHASTSFWQARNFHAMAQGARNENQADQVIVRIALWGLWQDWASHLWSAEGADRSREFWCVLLDTHAHAKHTFQRPPDAYGKYVANTFGVISRSYTNKEVLLCYLVRINLDHLSARPPRTRSCTPTWSC